MNEALRRLVKEAKGQSLSGYILITSSLALVALLAITDVGPSCLYWLF